MDVNTKDGVMGFTSLMYAAILGKRQIVRFLLKQGADIKAKTKTGHTLLHIASHGGIDWLVEDLIKKGWDVNVGEKDKGNTPLIFAVLQEHLSTAKLLLENGVDINARNKAGKTALHAALLRENGDMVDLLINKDIKMTKTEIKLIGIFKCYMS